MSTTILKQTDLTKFSDKDGTFRRKDSQFRNFIEKEGRFTPEKDRYHLFVAYGCPWATRTLIARKLKGLEDVIPVTILSSRPNPNSWAFAKADPDSGADFDPLYNSSNLREFYFRADPEYTGRFTVPVLWDKKTETIVNNESSEIIRIFNSAFNEFLPADKAAVDLYPEALRTEIDALNSWVYNTVNNGVYKAGFAGTQEAYEAAVIPLFGSLDRLEKLLDGKDYLIGNKLTEADVRLFVTIIRFDVAYYGNFKCNLRSIRDGYPAIHLWLRKLYWNNPAFSETCKFDQIKTGYYSHAAVNPTFVVPVGPVPHILPL